MTHWGEKCQCAQYKETTFLESIKIASDITWNFQQNGLFILSRHVAIPCIKTTKKIAAGMSWSLSKQRGPPRKDIPREWKGGKTRKEQGPQRDQQEDEEVEEGMGRKQTGIEREEIDLQGPPAPKHSNFKNQSSPKSSTNHGTKQTYY